MSFLPATYGLDGSFDPTDPLGSVLDAAPELASQPSLAQAALSADDPNQAAQVLSHAQYIEATEAAMKAQAANGEQHSSILGSLIGKIADLPGLSQAIHWANKPLQEVQQDYKYLHSVYVKHGFFNGALATLGIAGAGLGGFAVAGPVGAIAATTAAGFGTRQAGRVLTPDSYAQSNDPNAKISFGRDVANALGAGGQTDSGWGKYVSGIADALFDFKADPLILAGRAAALRRTGQLGAVQSQTGRAFNQLLTKNVDYTDPGLLSWARQRGLTQPVKDSTGNLVHGPDGRPLDEIKPGTIGSLAARSQSARSFLDRVAPSQKIATADQVQNAYEALGGNNQFARAARTIVKWNGEAPNREYAAGRIVDQMPDQQGLAWELAGATSPEDVARVYQRATYDTEMMRRVTIGTLPSRSLLRVKAGDLSNRIKSVGGQSTLSGQRIGSTDVADETAPGVTAAGGQMGRTARVIRTFTGYKPYAIDNGLLSLSGRTFDPTDPGSLQGVLRSMRYSMGNDVARQYAGRMAAASSAGDLGAAKAIWAEANIDMLKAAGLPDDLDLVKRTTDQVRQLTHGPEDTQVYGVDRAGSRDISSAPVRANVNGQDVEGTGMQALREDQVGKFSFPDYDAVKRSMRGLHRWSNLYGKVDDFLADHFTNSIFKPFALLTAGFGLRIAAAEGIPAAMRYGAMNMLRAKVADISAKRNYAKAAAGAAEQDIAAGGRLSQDEIDHIIAASMRASGGVAKALAGPELWDSAVHQVMDFDGHIVQGASATGHNAHILPDVPSERQAAIVQHMLGRGFDDVPGRVFLRNGDDYRLFADPNDPLFAENWAGQLQRSARSVPYQRMASDYQTLKGNGFAQDRIEREMVRSEADRIRQGKAGTGHEAYNREAKKLSRYTNQTPEEFAADRVAHFFGLTTGRDGTVHDNFVDSLAKGKKPAFDQVKAVGPDAAPVAVVGPQQVPYIGGGNLRARIVNEGFKRVVDPIINGLSREPLFTNAVLEEQRALRPAVQAGLIDDQTSRYLSYRRASHAILPQIHNTMLRSQFSELVRNFLPFYFAQEQAVKRYGHLLHYAPAAFREFQLINHGLHDPGFVQTDGSGNRYLAIPMVGELGHALQSAMGNFPVLKPFGPMVGALPASFTGSLDSLGTVLPEAKLPGVGPLAAVSLKWINTQFPESVTQYTGAGLKEALGDQGYTASLMDQLIPNAPLRNAIKAIRGSQDDPLFHNAYLSALAAAHYHGLDVKRHVLQPDGSFRDISYSEWDPAEQQAFLDRVRNNARSLLMAKAVLGMFSPLAPRLDVEDVNKRLHMSLRDEFYLLLKPKDQGGVGLDYQTALASFLKEHGDDAISYTIAKSDNTSGATVPNSKEALDFVTQNKDLIHDPRFHGAAAFLVPQVNSNDGDATLIHQELLKQHLREQRTPTDFMAAVYEQAGNQQYYSAKAVHDAAIADMTTRGDHADLKAETLNWKQWKESFASANPLWAASFDSPTNQQRAKLLLNGMLDMFHSAEAGQLTLPVNDQTQLVAGLLDDWTNHQLELARIGSARTTAHKRKVENDAWQAYLEQKTQDVPALAGTIHTIFLPLNSADAAYLARTSGEVG